MLSSNEEKGIVLKTFAKCGNFDVSLDSAIFHASLVVAGELGINEDRLSVGEHRRIIDKVSQLIRTLNS